MDAPGFTILDRDPAIQPSEVGKPAEAGRRRAGGDRAETDEDAGVNRLRSRRPRRERLSEKPLCFRDAESLARAPSLSQSLSLFSHPPLSRAEASNTNSQTKQEAINEGDKSKRERKIQARIRKHTS